MSARALDRARRLLEAWAASAEAAPFALGAGDARGKGVSRWAVQRETFVFRPGEGMTEEERRFFARRLPG